jgi:bifunctional UDP-N-acetylglucosamine pyrophosphorylase / glucosamine-1-phosphate N-acetyltransferase
VNLKTLCAIIIKKKSFSKLVEKKVLTITPSILNILGNLHTHPGGHARRISTNLEKNLKRKQENKALNQISKAASIIFAAGKGSRMKSYEGNKTLLPLVPGKSAFEGTQPILIRIIGNLPPGPKAVVVNYKKEDVISATRGHNLTYCEQPQVNGTGGALLSTKSFLENIDSERVLITMGDVPLVEPATFETLLKTLDSNQMSVLGFRPSDKKEYGMLEILEGRVIKIIEWKYWSKFPMERQDALEICNSGIYAASRTQLLHYMDILSKNPHKVMKGRDGRMVEVEEFFITDLVEMMSKDGLNVGYSLALEDEVMGVDDLQSLQKARGIFNLNSPRQGHP